MRPLVLLLLIAPALAHARLGEKEEQLTARFGTPVGRTSENTMAQGKILEFGYRLTYRQEEWTITVVIVDGRSVQESYHKPGDWTDAQITAVLNSNTQGAKWTDETPPSARKFARKWRRSDGGGASWSQSGITVTHPAYQKAKDLAATKAKAAAAKVPKI